MQPMFVNGMCPGKSLKTSLLSAGKPWNLVFAIPGKSWKMGFECLRTLVSSRVFVNLNGARPVNLPASQTTVVHTPLLHQDTPGGETKPIYWL